MMEVAVILVNWNQAKTTIRCIESLLQHTAAPTDFSYRIIVIDNNSQESSVRILENYLAERQSAVPLHLIKNDRNAGFAGGNNVGIRFALDKHQPDYIWLLNNDIIVQPQALNKLVDAAMKYPKPKIWGSSIYEINPELHFHCAGGFRYNALLSIPTPIKISPTEAFSQTSYGTIPEMDYPAGASMFIRSDTFRKHGLLNETYFLYYEELDFVHQIGGKAHLAWCPESVLHHQAGKSTGSQNPNKGKGSWIAHYYGNLSALKYTWLYHPLYFPVVFLFRLGSKAALFVIHRDLKGFPPLIKAYFDFFKWICSKQSSDAK